MLSLKMEAVKTGRAVKTYSEIYPHAEPFIRASWERIIRMLMLLEKRFYEILLSALYKTAPRLKILVERIEKWFKSVINMVRGRHAIIHKAQRKNTSSFLTDVARHKEAIRRENGYHAAGENNQESL